jgi:integrase
MAVLQLLGQRLIVKYLYENHGSPYFQMRVPEDLYERFGSRKKISIALREEDGPPSIQVQRLAKNHKALFKAMRNDPSLSTADEKVAALALLQSHRLKVGDGNIRLENWTSEASPNDQPHLDSLVDELIETSRERPLNRVEQLALKALKGPLPVSLSEALAVYFENHPKGRDKTYIKKVTSYWNKLVHFVGDVAVETLTREQAKAFIVQRLEKGVKRSSVIKEINIVRAIITKAIRELELSSKNPFESITVPSIPGSESEQRMPFSLEEHRLLIEKAFDADDDIRLIVLICAMTGCRIGEAVGLRIEDLNLDSQTPYFRIQAYGQRTLKTGNSERDVPVLPLLKKVLSRHIKASIACKQEPLFARYNNMVDPPRADAASASVNKWIGSVGITKTSHSFRHSVISLFREAGIPRDLWEEVTGHSGQRISDGYGVGVSHTRKYEALSKGLKPLLHGF